jgi:conjugative transfer signal peptidase TraF
VDTELIDRRNRLRLKPAVFSVIAGTLVLFYMQSHFYFVRSDSVPAGLYKIDSTRHSAFAAICLPPRAASILEAHHFLEQGTCPDGSAPVIKQVSNSASLSFTASGVSIDGKLLPNTAPLPVDRNGMPLDHFPFGNYPPRGGRIWAFRTYNPRSFDSRYFGFIPAACIIHYVKPWLTWPFS